MRSIILAATLFLLPFGVLAQDFQTGLDAFENDDYATALENWRALAEEGDADSQHSLGVMYFLGLGVAKDGAQGAHWMHKAAKQGHVIAQSNLGQRYAYGLGVPQDDAKSFWWYRKAAKQGDANAQRELAFKYAHGLGVPRDNIASLMWANIAVANGASDAVEMRSYSPVRMTNDSVMEAERRAKQCMDSGYQNCD